MIARVAKLWRYPVKSLRGESLGQADVRLDGFAGDRLVHIRERGGRLVTARSYPQLLGVQASIGGSGEPLINGLAWRDSRSLKAVRAASVADAELCPSRAGEHRERHDDLPITILTDGMARAVGVDHRRFRPNIFIEGPESLDELDWVGKGVRIGSVVLGVRGPRRRCVMTTFDPDTLEQDPRILKRIVTEFDARVALECWVIETGCIRSGDVVESIELPSGTSIPAARSD